MKLKLIILLALSQVLIMSGFAQGKKVILKNKIKSITENVTLYEKGLAINYKEHYVLYNKAGEELIEADYNKDGSIRKQEIIQYSSGKNKLEETTFRQSEEMQKKPLENKKTIYKYNKSNDKIEEAEYSAQGKMTKKVEFTYNNLGEKISEQHYDGENKLTKKITYTYNGKGLRIKRESRLGDSNNTLETLKQYVYEFY